MSTEPSQNAAPVPPDGYSVFVRDLRIVEGVDDDGPCALYLLGHVASEPFRLACISWARDHGHQRPGPPRFTWWRKVSCRDGMQFRKAQRGARGAFPVTVCDLRPWTA